MAYDPNNVFAKILRGEIPCKKVFEDDHVLSFHDINPKAPIHVLVIPKGAYTGLNDFCAHAKDHEIAAFFRAVRHISESLGLTVKGYRLISNYGPDGGQEVPHFHVHIFGGKRLGAMVSPA